MELETLMEEGAAPGPGGESDAAQPTGTAENGNCVPLVNGDKTRGSVTGVAMEQSSKVSKGSTLNLYLASCTANMGALAAGCALTWSSPTILKLQRGDPSFNLIINEEEATWVGSLVTLGAAIGPILSGAILDRLGRKNTVLLSMVLSMISWITIGFIPNLYVLYGARVLSGVAVGLIFTAVPTYIAEIAMPHLRSSLGTLMQFFLCFGFLIEFIVGPYTSYLTLVLVSLTTPILCFGMFVWMPDSPHSLLGRPGRETQALESLRWLRGNPQEAILIKELGEIKRSIEETQRQKSSFGELFANKGNIKAVIIACSMVGFQQLSGINVVLLFSETIFQKTGAQISPSICTIIVGSVMLVAAAVTPSLAKFFSMKTLLYISAVGMALTEGVLGFYFYMLSKHQDVSTIGWLPVTSLVLFIITYCLGFGPLPWAIMGEVFPANLKSVASALTASFCWFLGFVLSKSFNTLCSVIGEHFAFWMFSGFCVVALLFTIFILPDTEGKTLPEIQDMLHGRNAKPSAKDKTTVKA
ncbi:facilitated trehalose transporter Tret1-like isoform X2 [Adelges cooleyi]|nr:facilitated trehalose transporter Tret1-like isoform X2 [Adelges cooleyi]XP_050436602.1 facilitated trehalose transporter Tret1-like isoform X2 [Adelges cooleyi]XP_050436603.1 facilitated trehalose transporter Tret1-like isoform X2 [Adelges cooleyi]